MLVDLTNEELAVELKRAHALATVCKLHGYIDGHTAHAATATALDREKRERDRHPMGADRPALNG